jgi:thiol-disulfide isomerase/thioredoxin/outer membrane lipoprotein-sorting protein
MKGNLSFATGCRLALALATLWFSAAGCSKPVASSPAAVAEPADARERGEEITSKMLAAYRAAGSYADHATYVQQSVYRGEGVEREQPFFHMTLAFERPNRLRLSFQEAVEGSAGSQGFDIASNGVMMRSTSGALAGQVQESAAPATITPTNLLPDPMLRDIFGHRALGDVFPQLAMLLNADDKVQVFPEDEQPKLLGTQTLRGRECYRVATTSPKGTRTFWIDAENYALLRVELPIEGDRDVLDPDKQYSKLAVWIDFEDAAFDAKIDANAFKIEVAKDARRVRRFVAPPPAAPPDLLGKPLADFQFKTLDGKPVTPKTLGGKTILLDFWQIDCKPCKAHTPDLEQVYKELKDDDNFAFYAVNMDGPRAPGEAIARTLSSWGGTMPVLLDPAESAWDSLKIEGTPTLMLLDRQGRLQYIHLREHRDSKGLTALVRRVLSGVDLAAAIRAEHQQLTKEYERELAAVTIKDETLDIKVPQPQAGDRKLPKDLAVTELWHSKSETVARPGYSLVIKNSAAASQDDREGGERILILDGGEAIVELDANGAAVARHELPNNAGKAGGFLRAATDSAGRRYVAASGLGWQKVCIFDDDWKPVLVFPKERHPGVADVQLAPAGGAGEPRLLVGYWGGVGVQGVGLNGLRQWSQRSLDQVVQLALLRNKPDAPVASLELWCTSNRGTITVLDADGNLQREFAVGLRALMHIAAAEFDGALHCCGLALETPGQYQAIGFSPEGDLAWQYRLPAGEYARQVERIQYVTLPGGKNAWMIPSANGAIHWLDPEGKLIDTFAYGEPLTGLSLTNSGSTAILLVSTADKLTAWKLNAGEGEP